MRPDEPNKPNKKLERNNVFAANKKNIKNGNNFARLVGLLTILLVCGSVAYFAHAYFSAMSSVQQAYRGTGKTSQLISQKKPISILILGVDQGIEGRHDRGNSDTMILATMNPQKKEATLILREMVRVREDTTCSGSIQLIKLVAVKELHERLEH